MSTREIMQEQESGAFPMTDHSELKRLAEAAPEGPWFGPEYAPGTSYVFDVDLGSLLHYESIDTEQDACLRYVAAANPAAVLALIAESDKLKDENEVARMRIKELDLLFGRYILAMRAAVIEEEHGNGRARAMEWIYNSLAGPGELPPEDATNAQAYFDAEIVAVDNGMQEVLAFHDARRAAKEKI